MSPSHATDSAPADLPATEAGPRGVRVEGLQVGTSERTIVEPLDLFVEPGEMLAIIGESGSGKSLTARAITGLLPRGVHAAGSAEIAGFRYDLASTQANIWRQVRGRRAVLLLQDPFTSLSPVLRCGEQIALTIRARAEVLGQRLDRAAVTAEVTRRLSEVQLPARVAGKFPTELSGGMRQRVAITAALAAEPELLIADEPTTALDASTQGEVLDLLRALQAVHRTSLILISHDLGVIDGRADRVMVMRQGEVVERGTTARVLSAPEHSYTRALIEANPSVSDAVPAATAAGSPVLVASGLTKNFGTATALSDASVDVAAGEIVAIVGESGSGKSTLARAVAGLEVPDTGTVLLHGKALPRDGAGASPARSRSCSRIPIPR
ncbi:ATP-binding cassette domain-containing protein [Leucobacter insecticola]|uniref:ATP-binding cassette domain-containing protein n=1 Tax=Leucobacter insecticola TaxID=2714934 RepID=UPI00244DB81A|nr:ATP-binding cassette domain-containing protein [Leucobacter insecticola]